MSSAKGRATPLLSSRETLAYELPAQPLSGLICGRQQKKDWGGDKSGMRENSQVSGSGDHVMMSKLSSLTIRQLLLNTDRLSHLRFTKAKFDYVMTAKNNAIKFCETARGSESCSQTASPQRSCNQGQGTGILGGLSAKHWAYGPYWSLGGHSLHLTCIRAAAAACTGGIRPRGRLGGFLTWIAAVRARFVARSRQHVLQEPVVPLRFQCHGDSIRPASPRWEEASPRTSDTQTDGSITCLSPPTTRPSPPPSLLSSPPSTPCH
ncbi:hypothetical protein FQN60_002636, partial [Etheostoma spectabile]